ncbi:MAG: alanine racemase [Actinobacteria bacterium]|nr:alanine racemase [Actinomycetota bacterium]
MLPLIRIDLKKIEHNTRTITSTFNSLGIEMVGVTKACLGSPNVAGAMIAGGASLIADSRLLNLRRLINTGVPLMALRQPMHSEIPQVAEITDICLVSELSTIRLLSGAAESIRKRYKVIVMVETGDLREGVLPGDLLAFVKEAMDLPWIDIEGIGTNVACLQGISPTPAVLERLVESAYLLRKNLGIELPVISGGNSSAWKLIETGLVPSEVNQFRLGEAILLGQETINFDPIPGTFQDAIILEAEIIEVKEKPVLLHTRNVRKRAILALGVQDICRGEMRPLDTGAQLLRRSSDHLVIDVTGSQFTYGAGDSMAFLPSYEAMLAAMTSPFVEKVFV